MNMPKKIIKEKVTLTSNDAIRGKPWLDIDRVLNVKESKQSEEK